MSKGSRASAFFLSRRWKKEAERAEFLEGKIKARSRKRSQVVVCTSFFWETIFGKEPNGETLGAEATLFCGFGLSPRHAALPMACVA
jgi:hypothetical protein